MTDRFLARLPRLEPHHALSFSRHCDRANTT